MISISILLFYPIPTRNTEIDLSEGFGVPKDPLIMGVTWVRFPSPAPILFVIPFMIGEVFGSRVLRRRLWVI